VTRNGKDELAELEDKIKKTKLSKESPREGHARTQEAAADVSDVGRGDRRAQLSRLAAVDPWNKESKVKKDLKHAQEILDADHFGLEKVKSASSSISPCSSAPTS